MRIAWIAAATLTVFVLWLLADSDANPGIAFFYAVPIGLTTWWFGRRVGTAAALGCCCLYIVGTLIEPVPNVGLALALRALAFGIVVVLVSVARERLVVLEHSAEELEDIRAALTPASLPTLGEIDAGAAFVPSDHGVSGDFYLLTNGPDGSAVAVVGDVVGHGPRAARLATFIRARFATFATNTSDPAEILRLANAALVERPGRSDELVSAVCLRYEPSTATLSWAVAGHPPPLRLPNLDELRHEGTNSLLGIELPLPLTVSRISLGPAEGVLVYTDGVTDLRREQALLGAEGLTRLLGPLAALPARALAEEAQRAILEWADRPIPDDICLLVLRPR